LNSRLAASLHGRLKTENKQAAAEATSDMAMSRTKAAHGTLITSEAVEGVSYFDCRDRTNNQQSKRPRAKTAITLRESVTLEPDSSPVFLVSLLPTMPGLYIGVPATRNASAFHAHYSGL